MEILQNINVLSLHSLGIFWTYLHLLKEKESKLLKKHHHSQYCRLNKKKGKTQHTTLGGDADAPYVYNTWVTLVTSSWGSDRALIALGKESKSVNLPDEIGHASPSSKSKANYQHPYHYKCVYHIHGCPAREEKWKLLSRILHTWTLHH